MEKITGGCLISPSNEGGMHRFTHTHIHKHTHTRSGERSVVLGDWILTLPPLDLPPNELFSCFLFLTARHPHTGEQENQKEEAPPQKREKVKNHGEGQRVSG